jgi:predicted nucleotidyltransferase
MNVLNILRSHQPEITQRFGVRRIGLFVSFARGEAGPESV